MVFLSTILFSSGALKHSRRLSRNSFIDSLRIYVRGGTGGNGLPKRGGIGGKGGDVYVVAKEGVKLQEVVKSHATKRIVAGSGGHSQLKGILGEPGKDIVIEVPVGITVYDEYGRNLGELNTENSKFLVAQGGAGGCPVTHFTGLSGQAHCIILDLKLIADVGLLGFPNAGKSSLLKAVSRSKPKIASYPFTTIEPKVGVLAFKDDRQITMADLPGLIEGAHANVGMGHKFLKHVERTKLLLMVVDINGFRLSPKHPHRSALETIVLLNKELELYQEDLLKKPILLAVNKMDTRDAQKKWQELEEKLNNFKSAVADFPEQLQPSELIEFWDVMNISVLSCNKSVLELKDKIRYILDYEAEKLTEDAETELRSQLRLKMIESGPSVV